MFEGMNLIGAVFMIILGTVTLALGAKAFSPAGLPVTIRTRWAGRNARIVGAFCILVGLGWILTGFWLGAGAPLS